MKKGLFAVLIALIVLAISVGFDGAISNGEPDGDNHLYVAYINDGTWECSGSAISSTVLVTAAHCFDSADVFVAFDPEPPFTYYTGTWYPDPDWCLGCGGGLPGFDRYDVAVVVLDAPVELSRYADLPSEFQVDTLANNTDIDLVGCGVQFDYVGGPRIPYDGAFTRYCAQSQLVDRNHVHSDEYIKLTANPSKGKGGTCFGDSGGPDLLGGADIILAVNSYVTNENCAGVTYSNRIDTYALDFIGGFLNL